MQRFKLTNRGYRVRQSFYEIDEDENTGSYNFREDVLGVERLDEFSTTLHTDVGHCVCEACPSHPARRSHIGQGNSVEYHRG